MTVEQAIIFATLLITLFLFIHGRLRYDVVAVLALLVVAGTGLIPVERAFLGFGNPAVVTVAAIFVMSQGLQNSGVIDRLGRALRKLDGHITWQMAALVGMVMLLSAFMNNVGALALLLPVAIQMARRNNLPPSIFLMPLAFGSLLGGMTTLIGTPPNIILASYRVQTGAPPFGMFDFTPVGLSVAVAGVLFIVAGGWRLIPLRRGRRAANEIFEIEQYLTEVRVPPGSKLIGRQLREISSLRRGEAVIVDIIRGDARYPAPSRYMALEAGDILVLKVDTNDLEELAAQAGLELVGSQQLGRANLRSEDVALMEAVIMPNSSMIGETARSLDLRRRFGVNLLAIARAGAQLQARLDHIHLHAGDVVLLQAHVDTLQEVLATLGCLPLAERSLRIGRPRRVFWTVGIFGGAILLAAFNLVPVQLAFVAAALGLVFASMLTLREVYDAIDWPVIILLGAMIPVGEALETTGGAQLIADSLLRLSGHLPAAVTLGIVLVATMTLSDVINNAATVVLMAPIALRLAAALGVSADPFLMAVAVGASCAFLTPIGHQSNTLVMGPGGYHFGDYWRLGLPLEIVVVAVGLPVILLVWPL